MFRESRKKIKVKRVHELSSLFAIKNQVINRQSLDIKLRDKHFILALESYNL